jgi:Na+/proline symporter
MKDKQIVVLIGATTSIIIFIALLILQGTNASILKLESRWLMLAGVPLLVALIVGGYNPVPATHPQASTNCRWIQR